MAENKKSFIAYSDWYGMLKACPDDVAGKLIKHIFAYVNDENPSSDDFVINALFEQIKATLKRDLVKWEEQREQRSNAGKKSAELRAMKFNERSTVVNEPQRNSTVSVSVSDNVKEDNNIDSRKLKFAATLKPFVDEFGRDTLKDFYDYWTEPNKSNTKFRQELEKTWSLDRRIQTWIKNESNFKPNKNKNNEQLTEITAAARIANPRI
jgi:hypothetical protein